MLLMPDPDTAFMDPFRDTPTLVMICDVGDPITKKPYPRDPRQVALKAEAFVGSSGVADKAFFGAEAEFFIFDSIRFDSQPQHSFYYLGAVRAAGTRAAKRHNLGNNPLTRKAISPCPPMDPLQDIRTEMVVTLIEMGIPIEAHHHEVATGGQCEIDMRFRHAGEDGRQRDDVQVRHQERRRPARQESSPSCPSRSLATTAPACTRTCRSGKMANRFLPATNMRA